MHHTDSLLASRIFLVLSFSLVPAFPLAAGVATGDLTVLAEPGFVRAGPVLSGNGVLWNTYALDAVKLYEIAESSSTVLDINTAPYLAGADPVFCWGLRASGARCANRISGAVFELPSQAIQDMDGSRVVWWSAGDIYLYDFSTGHQTQVTNDAHNNEHARISGDNLVWQSRGDIHTYNLGSGIYRNLTNDSDLQQEPEISGNYAVWLAYSEGWKIRLFDFRTGDRMNITSGLSRPDSPTISGDLIVWEDRRHGNSDIFMFDISDQFETQLTYSPWEDRRPSVHGSRIAWSADYVSDSDGATIHAITILDLLQVVPASVQIIIDLLEEAVDTGWVASGVATGLSAILSQAAVAIQDDNVGVARRRLEIFAKIIREQPDQTVLPATGARLEELANEVIAGL